MVAIVTGGQPYENNHPPDFKSSQGHFKGSIQTEEDYKCMSCHACNYLSDRKLF